jgi:hypothetical protein
MYQLFYCASQTVVWLDEVSNDSEEALDLVNLCGRGDETELTDTIFDIKAMQRCFDEGNILSSRQHEEFLKLANLFAQPWWRRVWVIQEMAFSENATMICGRKELQCSLFTRANDRLWACYQAALSGREFDVATHYKLLNISLSTERMSVLLCRFFNLAVLMK